MRARRAAALGAVLVLAAAPAAAEATDGALYGYGSSVWAAAGFRAGACTSHTGPAWTDAEMPGRAAQTDEP